MYVGHIEQNFKLENVSSSFTKYPLSKYFERKPFKFNTIISLEGHYPLGTICKAKYLVVVMNLRLKSNHII